MTNTDPGEGSALANDNFVAVYGGKSILDMFYPVGSYYETSDTTFDPNTAWGGTWQKDTTGRVTIAQDSGSFATVGNVGGSEKHTHEYGLQYGGYWRDTIIEEAASVGLLSYDSSNNITLSGPGSNLGAESTHVNNNSGDGQRAIGVARYRMTANAKYTSTLPPYIVVVRWHRTA